MEETQLGTVYPFLYCFNIFISILVPILGKVAVKVPGSVVCCVYEEQVENQNLLMVVCR